MGKLDKLTHVEDSLVGAESLTESKRTGRVVDGIEVTVSSTNATVRETGMTVNQMSVQVGEVQEMLGSLMVSVNEGKTESSEEREKALQAHVLKVLRPSKVDHAQDWYDKINKARIPGTGDWVREEGGGCLQGMVGEGGYAGNFCLWQSWCRQIVPVGKHHLLPKGWVPATGAEHGNGLCGILFLQG
jgi:hypothetical protein